MAKHGALVGKIITLKPTQGGYQKPARGTIEEETPTRITVRLAERYELRTFLKSDGQPYSRHDAVFPRYVADMTSISD